MLMAFACYVIDNQRGESQQLSISFFFLIGLELATALLEETSIYA